MRVLQDAAMSSGPTNCDKGVTLDCLRALYNFDYELVAADKNTMAIGAYFTSYVDILDSQAIAFA